MDFIDEQNIFGLKARKNGRKITLFI